MSMMNNNMTTNDSVMDNSNQWGDIGEGFYKNPILNADYSDPDIIRVGDDFYMVCSDFHFMGIPVLHSRDLVNWTIIGRIYDSLKIHEKYDEMSGYGQGSWAPAIKFNDGQFYVYFCTPEEGVYMSSAVNPAGPWTPLHEVKRVKGWEDPCPFWDEDGTAYLGHSTLGAGPIVIHRMSQDGKQLLDEGTIVYVGEVAEGTKIYKRNQYYYLVIPEGGVEIGWQTVLRSKNIFGPYEHKVVLETRKTDINGPHQGGMVELASGQSWFVHFQSAGILGRVCHLQPVNWVDDWPIMGMNGEPVSIYRKPDVGETYPVMLPQSSDNFEGSDLGLQWQWNHNPVHENWSLSKKPGFLSLTAMQATDIYKAKNTLTQKLMGETGEITVKFEASIIEEGLIGGLAFLGGDEENWIGIEAINDSIFIKAVTGGVNYHGPEFAEKSIWVKTKIDIKGKTLFYFSLDGLRYYKIGGECRLEHGYWKGARVGLFSYNTLKNGGRIDFDLLMYNLHK